MNPVQQHLNRDHHQQHAHQPLHRSESPLTQQLVEYLVEHQDHRAGGPGHKERQRPVHHPGGLLIGQQHQRCEDRRTGDHRDRHRHQEGLLARRQPGHAPLTWEDHLDGDQEQDDTPRNADRLLPQVEEAEDLLTNEQEQHHDGQREEQLAHHHLATSFGIDMTQDREEDRQVAQRVHDQKQHDCGRESIHTTPGLRPE